MDNLFLLPNSLHELVNSLEDHIDTLFPDRKITLPVKIRRNDHNSIITWNIFPYNQMDLGEILKDLNEIISSNLLRIPKSELIAYNIDQGKILDSGIEAFRIKSGFIYDLYIYDPEIFVYTRLLQEFRLNDQSKQWISIDIDVVTNSAWFSD